MRLALAFGIASAVLTAGCSSAPAGSPGPAGYAGSPGYAGGYAGYSGAPVAVTPAQVAESSVPAPAAEPAYGAPAPAIALAPRTASGNSTSDGFLPPPEIRGGRFPAATAALPVVVAPIVARPPVIAYAPPPAALPVIRTYRNPPPSPAMRVGRPAPVVRKAAGPECPT